MTTRTEFTLEANARLARIPARHRAAVAAAAEQAAADRCRAWGDEAPVVFGADVRDARSEVLRGWA